MRALVTGSAGHLGEGLVRVLRAASHEVVGLDLAASPYTNVVGSITDAACVRDSMRGADVVFHAATLHKPHVVTHTRQQFVDSNVTGTLTLLEEAVRVGLRAFVFTSSTSAFGDALRPPAGSPAAWITEDVVPVPKNIYGVTKLAAEDLCRLLNRKHGLGCVVLRTSRFFPDEDDDPQTRRAYEDGNVKANELLFRRVDLEDVVEAHLLAADKAQSIGFGRFIVSATTPFLPGDAQELRRDAAAVVQKYVPQYREAYERLGWRMFPTLDRVYVNAKARDALGWKPKRDFAYVVECLRKGVDPRSELARAVGVKAYHTEVFAQGMYPVE
jgi:UDP-glucose 4-epimerase